jgi:membrane-associated phospholipid phosphatase
VLARLKSEWRLKLLLLFAVNVIFWTFYQVLSRHAFLPLHTVPTTWLDRAVPYQPAFWSGIYLSQFLFTAGVPLMLTKRDDIRRFVTTMTIMSSIAFAIFLCFPTQCPRPPDVGSDPLMKWIASADGPLNALPSLHAAFLVCIALLAVRIFGRKALPTAVIVMIAIAYSTLATKQHYALDLLAGGALGWLADWMAWRGASADATMAVRSGVASHGGER